MTFSSMRQIFHSYTRSFSLINIDKSSCHGTHLQQGAPAALNAHVRSVRFIPARTT